MKIIVGYDKHGNALHSGDYVVYDPGYKEVEIGRVSSCRNDRSVFVCYHAGDSAAATDQSMIRKISNQEMILLTALGGNQFDK